MSSRYNVSNGDSFPTGCAVWITGAIILFVLLLIGGCTSVQRVDPGNVGVLVDFGKASKDGQPAIAQIPTGSYRIINPVYQRVVEYPISQQTLTMVASEKEGQVVGDDSTLCQARGGVSMYIDTSTIWRVDTAKASQLYLLRPGLGLTGDVNSSIAGIVVRPEVRNAVNIACAEFAYDEVLADRKAEFQSRAEEIARTSLAGSYIVVDRFFMRGAHLDKAQKDAIAAKVTAQQQAQAAAFLKQKAENEAAGAIAQAQGEAEANRIRTASLTPEVLRAREIDKWDGKLPQTVVVRGDDSPTLLPLR